MYMAISNSIGIKGYYWVAELPLLTRENLSVDTKGAYFRLPDEVMAEGSRIGENDRFLGPPFLGVRQACSHTQGRGDRCAKDDCYVPRANRGAALSSGHTAWLLLLVH